MTQVPKLLNDPADGALQIVCALIAAGRITSEEKAVASLRSLTVTLSGNEALPEKRPFNISSESVNSYTDAHLGKSMI